MTPRAIPLGDGNDDDLTEIIARAHFEGSESHVCPCRTAPCREDAMVTLERDDQGVPTVWCDPCMVPLVTALNTAGLATAASCCTHGGPYAWVLLEDGTAVMRMSRDDADRVEQLLADRPDPGRVRS